MFQRTLQWWRPTVKQRWPWCVKVDERTRWQSVKLDVRGNSQRILNGFMSQKSRSPTHGCESPLLPLRGNKWSRSWMSANGSTEKRSMFGLHETQRRKNHVPLSASFSISGFITPDDFCALHSPLAWLHALLMLLYQFWQGRVYGVSLSFRRSFNLSDCELFHFCVNPLDLRWFADN